MYASRRPYCAACGAALGDKHWSSGPLNRERTYCSPACQALEARVEELYRTHAASLTEQETDRWPTSS